VSQALRGLLLLMAVFLVLPTVYEILRAAMPLICMLVGVLVVVKILLRKLPK
jgi:hypothetical protein